ncbi:hypothetical protein DH2020_047800 [Rehmannia glutinosa]|uniref:Uncharacterized protein n=1 Tax=Rehmannia glutinosa TaxID=99300 RepID=A0ABR0U7E5_REHGL
MLNLEHYLGSLVTVNDDLRQNNLQSIGGLFLEESAPASLVSLISPKKSSLRTTVQCSSRRSRRRGLVGGGRRRGGFLSVSLSSINDDGGGGEGSCGEELSVSKEKRGVLRGGGGGTLNTAKHLWAGAVAAMISRLSGNDETTNFERFVAGAAAGITATVLCIPMDTIRTVMVAPGGEALGGLVGTFRHMIQTEGFFSLYKGLVPSIISMAPSGAVFYGVYDILKSAYLVPHKGKKDSTYEETR